MELYHGSDHIVMKPVFKGGKRQNDYGYGFYTTENKELAKEWACSENRDGIVNCYEFDMSGLQVLNLNDPAFGILTWLSILANYRSYWQRASIAEEAKTYLREHFFVDPEDYDVIIGYRADDSYFSFAQDFVSNTISLRKLSEAMRLGKLGEQIVLKSEKAFAQIHFLDYEDVEAEVYYAKKANRDLEARRRYRESKMKKEDVKELYILDIMREGMMPDDPRLR